MERGSRAIPTSTATTRSSREPEALRARLEAWLASQLPSGADPVVASLVGTDANGMSSETLLVDAEWGVDGRRTPRPLVARLAPSPDDVPVFPTYDLAKQYEVMRIVRACSTVPVPCGRMARTGRARDRQRVLHDGAHRRPHPARRDAVQLR